MRKAMMTKQLNIAALTHPTMSGQIKQALIYAAQGKGHLMGGHGNRCYVANRHNRNIMRVDWNVTKQEYIIYGHESVNITSTVMDAMNAVGITFLTPLCPVCHGVMSHRVCTECMDRGFLYITIK
jgi:hypothetical protein